MKAGMYGSAAALLGCGVYYLVSLTGWEFGLIAIVVGYMVGHAVKLGSGGYGGLAFQLLAVLLTYVAIAGTNIPYVAKAMMADNQENTVAVAPAADSAGVPDETPVSGPARSPTFVVYIVAFFFSLAAPFLLGADNIMGLIILAIGLWEAWKVNRRVTVDLGGPYVLTPVAPDTTSPAQAQA